MLRLVVTDLDGICFIAHNGSYIEIDGAEFVKKLNDYKVEFKYTAKADLESGIGKISLMSLDDIETFVSGKDILDLNSTTCNKGTAITQCTLPSYEKLTKRGNLHY